MLYSRNRATNLLPIMIGLFLWIGGANHRVLGAFNRAGLCVSARTVERIRTILSTAATAEAFALFTTVAIIFIIIYDNINIYVKHYEQRLDKKNSMLNATNVAFIALPPDSAVPAGEDLQAKLDVRGKRSEDRVYPLD